MDIDDINNLLTIKSSILYYLIAIMLVLGTTNAWSILPNYQNYINVTPTNWASTYPFNAVNTLNSGITSYLTVNTAFNVILATEPIGYLNITAYTVNGVPIGVVDAYPYPTGNGLIISRYTTAGLSYNSITIWFNPLYLNPTYLLNFNRNNILSLESQPATTQLLLYNSSSIGIGGSSFSPSLNSATYAGTLALNFNLTSPYILLASTSAYNNVSLNYVPYQYGTFSYILNNTYNLPLQTLTVRGTPIISTTQTLYATNSLPINLYLNPVARSNYSLISYGGLAVDNLNIPLSGTAFNSINAVGYQDGTYFQSNNTQFNLRIYTPNTVSFAPLTTYYLIPAYSTHYILTTNTIANVIVPVNPLNNCVLDIADGFCFAYEQNISVSDWTFNFNTNAGFIPSTDSGGVPYTYNSPNSGYLLLNLTHYAQFGANCQYMLFDVNKGGFDYGDVPFSIVNCNATSSRALIILSNTTTGNYIYGAVAGLNVTMYFGATTQTYPLNIGQNIQLASIWQNTYGTGTNYEGNVMGNWYISISNPLTRYSFLGLTYSNPYTYGGFNGSGGGQTVAVVNGIYYSTPTIALDNSNPDLNFIFINQSSSSGGNHYYDFFNAKGLYAGSWSPVGTGKYSFFTGNILGGGFGGTTCCGFDYNSNSFSDITITLFSGTATFQRFFTSNYILYGIISTPYFNAVGFNGLPNAPITLPTTSNTFLTANQVSSIYTDLINYNTINAGNGLNNNFSLYGILLPMYYLALLIIIFIMLMVGMSSDEAHQPIYLGLVILWVVGIFEIPILILAVIITLGYIAFEIVEGGKRG